MSDKKYFWLKLKRDFFKRHDIHIIHGMENGREIVLFYIELMLESIDHEGKLRFSDSRPYTNGMLASLTNTPIEIVELSLTTLADFGLVEITEDKTIVLPKVSSMVGYETEWAKKKRDYRGQSEDKERTERGQSEDNVLDELGQCPRSDRTMSDKSKSIEIEKELETELERESNKAHARFEIPTVEEVYLYCEQRHNGIDAQRFVDYYTARGWKGIKDWKAQIRVWENRKDTET